jgi:SNF2 family DNA or RNA helicase
VITLPCHLSGRASTIYRALERYVAVEIGEGRVTVANGLVKLLRLQQVTGGFLPELDKETGEPTGVMVGVDPAKSDLLCEQIEDLPPDEPVVVFGHFKEDLAQIARVATRLGRPSYEISGARDELAAWNAHAGSAGAVLAVQLQAGSEAIDLTRARYCFYYTPSSSGGRMEQSKFRVHRPGQTRHTYLYRLVAALADGSPTVDADIYAGLDEDQNIVKLVLDRIAKRHGA